MTFELALIIVGILIGIVTIISGIVSIILAISYVRFNRIENSAGLTGTQVARMILDQNGLEDIEVRETGSILFGNSYSHYFKKVRLRRLTRHKHSLTSLGMGAQKASLAILDSEGDSDMRKRVRLYPLITFGPFAFLPLTIIGALLDYFIFKTSGICTLILFGVGLLFYLYALILSILTLKTEKKAQSRAYDILQASNLATEEELEKLQTLFKLYNIQYVNDIILSSLELLYRILEIVVKVKSATDN